MMSNKKKLIVKVTIPMIIQDNPMCAFTTRDGSFSQQVPLSSQIVQWMKGKTEAYFELWMSSTHIISMKPVDEKEYFAEPEQLKLFEGAGKYEINNQKIKIKYSINWSFLSKKTLIL